MENNDLFFKLPPELRLAVYDSAIVQRVTGPRTDPRSGFTRTLIPPNLARVNRQLRQEVIHEYYSKNEFWIEVPVIKNHVYQKFFAQCAIAAEFLPLIKSLCCESYLVPDGDWSVVYYNAASMPSNKWIHQREQEPRGYRVDWTNTIDSRDSFWAMMRDMIRCMEWDQLCKYTFFACQRKAEIPEPYLSMSDELAFIAKQCILGEQRMKAIFCYR